MNLPALWCSAKTNEVNTKTEPLLIRCYGPVWHGSKRKNGKPNRHRNTKTRLEWDLALKFEITFYIRTSESKMLEQGTPKAISTLYWMEIFRDFWRVFCVGASGRIRIHLVPA